MSRVCAVDGALILSTTLVEQINSFLGLKVEEFEAGVLGFFQGFSMDFHGFSMDFHGFSWIFNGFSWIFCRLRRIDRKENEGL